MPEPARFVEPMLAELADPSVWGDPPGWTYERKLDGLRCIAVRNGDDVELWSRNRMSFARFPAVVAAVRNLPVDHITLDGELVAWDGADYLGFGALQQPGSTMATVLCVFDAPHVAGHDTRGLALSDRRRILEDAVCESDHLHRSRPHPGPDLAGPCAAGWEGLVAKRTASPYRAGRGGDWRKLKCSASQELVIGGWTDPRGARSDLGALLVGYYDDTGLRYAGKVGTGFNEAALRSLGADLRGRSQPTSPFVDRVREAHVHWVRPELVANVTFSEWTRDGRLRHPRYEGLRPDKPASSVRRDKT